MTYLIRCVGFAAVAVWMFWLHMNGVTIDLAL